jgi:nicotinate dehydrogenase subunit A
MRMIRFTVNETLREVGEDPGTPLVVFLRETLGFRDTKFGCGQGRCGACAVIVEGQAVRSCQTPIRAVAGKRVTTIEGLGQPEAPHPLQLAIREAQGSQCGHCGAGIIMEVKAFLDRVSRPTEDQVREIVRSHECMCGSRSRVVKATLRYLETPGKP